MISYLKNLYRGKIHWMSQDQYNQLEVKLVKSNATVGLQNSLNMSAWLLKLICSTRSHYGSVCWYPLLFHFHKLQLKNKIQHHWSKCKFFHWVIMKFIHTIKLSKINYHVGWHNIIHMYVMTFAIEKKLNISFIILIYIFCAANKFFTDCKYCNDVIFIK